MWSSFPAEHKKRFYQGLCGYALICAALAAWIGIKADATIKEWQNNIPSAIAPVKAVAQTPSIFDTPQNVAAAGTGKYISIIITDLGLSAATTERALNELPPEISFSFSPYADNLKTWLDKSTDLKHENLISAPMESMNPAQDDPGPRALSTRLSDEENNDRLNWVLQQSAGALGVVNFMGSRFLSDKDRLTPVFQNLKTKNRIFIEAPGTENSQAANVAAQTGLPYLAIDLKLDSEVSESSIRRQFMALEKMAQERGYAIAIAEPYPITINMLKSWQSILKTQGITLAPLSTVWKNNTYDRRNTAPTTESIPN